MAPYASFLPGSRVRPDLLLFAAVIWLIIAQANTASAATFTVINTNDSGAGSLRQAILDNNSTVSGTNLIQFNIAGAGVQTIRPLTELPAVTKPVVIDGFTQPGASPNTLAVGNNAALKIRIDGSAAVEISGLRIEAGGCLARGLVVVNCGANGVYVASGAGSSIEGSFIGLEADGTTAAGNVRGIQIISANACRVGGGSTGARNVISANSVGIIVGFSSGNRIQGNYVGTDASGLLARGNTNGISAGESHFNLIGGTNALERNVISANGAGTTGLGGMHVSGNSNVIQGNYVGVNALGTGALGNIQYGLTIEGGTNNLVGGPLPGAGNVLSGNEFFGLYLLYDTVGLIVQGNRIGTSADGLSAIGNGNQGVFMYSDGAGVLIGGSGPGEGNLISGNAYHGLEIYKGNAVRVQGNWIGTDATGLGALGNGQNGINLDSGGHTVGGTNLGEGNLIAFNALSGVGVGSYGTGNRVLRNSIHSNAAGGIDLYSYPGSTLNDSGDGDTGANELQNFPVLTAAILTPTNVIVLGTLNSQSNRTYRLDFYGNPICDPSGYGEGKTWLGTTNVTTDGGGNVAFTHYLDLANDASNLTATATDSDGNTSEFSACRQTVAGGGVDLAVSISGTMDLVNVGDAFSYVVHVANNGLTGATGVVLTNALPPQVSFVSVTSSQGSCILTNGMVICDLGSLAALSGATVTLHVTAAATAYYAVADADVRANETENDLSNNFDYAITHIGATDLVFTRTLSTNFIVAGQPFTILLTASNAGPNVATSVYLSYTPDSSFAILSAELSQGSFLEDVNTYAVLGTIPVGATATLALHVISTDSGYAFDRGYADGAEYDQHSSDNDFYSYILINDGPGIFEFSDARYSIREDGGAAIISVTRLGGALGTTSVKYASADLTATAGPDYDAASGTLVFTNGEVTKTFAVLVHEDAISECNESVSLRLFNPAGGAVLVRNTNATLLIFEDDVSFVGAVEVLSLDTNTPPHVSDTYSYEPLISANGAFVAFSSYGQTLVTNDHNDFVLDVFLRDVTNRTTRLISVNTNGFSANGDSGDFRISADGRFVTFRSSATDLAASDMNTEWNIFLRNTLAGTTVLVSVNTNGTGSGDENSRDPQMTPDGRFIVFYGESRNLVTNELNGYRENIFLRDMSNSVVELITVNTNGVSANSESYGPTVSDDGRFVAFVSAATDLNATVLNHGPGGSDDYGKDDVYVRDRLNGTNILCSVATNGVGGNDGAGYDAVISANGKVVVFASYASNLAPGDTNEVQDVFAFDIPSRTVHLVSVNAAGTRTGNAGSGDPIVSANGRNVVFESFASDLVPGAGGEVLDTFVRDLVAGTTMLVSANCSGTGGGNDYSYSGSISADGRFVTFESYANDLVPGDFTSGRLNIFRRDLLAGTTLLVSFNRDLNGAGDHGSYYPAISADGRSIAFESEASNLVANDDNDAGDIFLWRAPTAGPSGTNASIASLRMAGGHPTLTVNGSPGTLYLLQRTTSLTPPVSWLSLGTTNAPASGQFEFVDPAPWPGSAFYRVARP